MRSPFQRVKDGPRFRYTAGLAAFVVALAIRMVAQPVLGSTSTYITFVPAVMLSAWYGGLGPGLGTTGLSALAAAYFFVEPVHSLWIANWTDGLGLILFLAAGGVISVLTEALRRAKRTAQEQFEELDRHRHIADVTLSSIGDAVITTNDRGNVMLLNRVAAKLTGWSQSDAKGRPLQEVFSIVNEHTRKTVENPVSRVLRDGTTVGLANHTVLISRNGSEIPIDDSAAPILDSDGTVLGVVLVFRDITERRRAEQALRESEERFRFALGAAEVGTWDWNVTTDEVRWSDNMEQIHDMPPGAFGRTFDSFLEDVDPESRQTVRDAIQRALDSDGVYEVEYRQARADGTTGWMEARGRAVRQDGEAVRMVGVCMNITERKKAAETTARLAAIVDSSHDAIVGKDRGGTIRTWNAAAERLYGYAAGEAIGQSMSLLLPAGREDEEKDILASIQAGARVDHFETIRIRKDGTPVHVSLTVSPIRDATGSVIGASHIARDVTERKLFEEQLRETAKLESLGVLAGGIAHDFNNLLTGILGNASLALDAIHNDDPARAMLERVTDASERAAALVRQILAYSGKGRFVMQLVDVSDLISSIVGMIQSAIPRTIELNLDLAPNLPAVEVDVAQMQQLVMNLVINAAESYGEGKPGTVTVRTALTQVEENSPRGMGPATGVRSGPYVRLEVADQGCGMDEATQARIFEPFFTTKFTGRGLGLAAVHGIVRGHKGTLEVDSSPGKGTTLKVLFPLAAGMLVRAAGEQIARDLNGRGTILVADDEQVVREIARRTLERYGYKVLVAENGRRALELFEPVAGQVSLVLLDMTMPVMSGEETLLNLKRIRPDVPVILSSGFNEMEAVRRFRGQELAGYLQKPYTAATLAEKVKAVAAS